MWNGNNFFMNGRNKYRTIRAFNFETVLFCKAQSMCCYPGHM